MANEGFNGTTMTFGTAMSPLISVSHTQDGAEVDVTGCADLMHTFEAGIVNHTITFTVVGVTSVAVGDTGAISVAWFDGSTTAITGGVCTNVSHSGDLDGALNSSITIKPGSACGTGT